MILKSVLTRVQHRGRIRRISTRDCRLRMSSPSNLWILSEKYLCLIPTSSRRTVSILKHLSYYLKDFNFSFSKKLRCKWLLQDTSKSIVGSNTVYRHLNSFKGKTPAKFKIFFKWISWSLESIGSL